MSHDVFAAAGRPAFGLYAVFGSVKGCGGWGEKDQ